MTDGLHDGDEMLTPGKPIPWLRVILEGLVIVGSILLAFGIDAWWDRRGEADRRVALLEALDSDFDVAEAELERNMRDWHNVPFNAASRWLALSRAGTPTADRIPVADTLISQMQLNGNYEPPMSSVEALLAEGNLSLVRSPELAAALTEWPSLVSRMQERQRNCEYVYSNRFLPYLIAADIPLADLQWGLGDSAEYPIAARHTDAYRLLDDVGWESVVSLVYWAHFDVREYEELLRPELERIRRLIAQEIDSN